MTPYPVFLSVPRPEKLERGALLWRIVFFVIFSIVGLTMGVVFAVLYLALPVIAAMGLSRRKTEGFLAEDSPRLARALRWVTRAYAYLMLLSDKLPSEDEAIRFDIEPGAWPDPRNPPTAAGAVIRVLFGLPSALVLVFLVIASWFVWLVAAVMILFTESYPEVLFGFQCGVLRWEMRLLAYQASLVEAYPPYSFDSGSVPMIHPEPLAH